MHFINLACLFFFSFCNACNLPATLAASDVLIYDGHKCPPNTSAITFKLLDPIKLDMCESPRVDNWGIINGGDCSLRGTGYGCQISQQQDPSSDEIMCAKCYKAPTCNLPPTLAASDVLIYDGHKCPPNTSAITFKLLNPIKLDVCDSHGVGDWDIINGGDCNIRGNAYGCEVSQEQDPASGEIMCAKCYKAPKCHLPPTLAASDVLIYDGNKCPPNTSPITFKLLNPIKLDMCDSPGVGDWDIINGGDCNLRGTAYGCQISQEQDPASGEIMCAKCYNSTALSFLATV